MGQHMVFILYLDSAPMGILAPRMCTLDGVAHPPINTTNKILPQVSYRHLPSPDSGGYVKFTPKYITVGGVRFF